MKLLIPLFVLSAVGVVSAAETVPPPPAPPSGEAPAPSAMGQPAGGQMPWMRGGFLGVQLEDGGAFDGKAMPRVTRVTPESGLDKLGVKAGDQIAKLGTTEVASAEAYRTAYLALKPGDELKLTIVRDGKSQELVGKVEPPPRPRERRCWGSPG